MKEKVAQSIRDLSIENKKILLAVSGGPDSMALFHSMLAMKDELNLQLLVAHVNHGLRPSAEEEADFVSELAARHGLPFYLLEEDMAALGRREQISEETAGRVSRYRFFHRIADETGSLIATGHHKDDQVETVLLHILRGTGVQGLAGMQPDGPILRPLLCVTKEEILHFLEQEGIPWVLDESNLETRYFRNRLRHTLLPLMRELQPGIDETLLTLSENARDAKEIIDDAVSGFVTRGKRRADEIVYRAKDFQAQKPSMQRAIIRATVLLLKGNDTDLSRAQTEEIRRVWNRPSGRGTKLAGLHFVVTQEGLVAKRESGKSQEALVLPTEGEIALPGGLLRIYAAQPTKEDWKNPDILYLPIDQADGLTVRSREADDRIRVFGSGGEKTIAKAMKDLKLRNDLRDSWPLLCRGSQVLWIIGRQKSEETRLTAEKPARAFEYIRRGYK